jgi:hypothetical protein
MYGTWQRSNVDTWLVQVVVLISILIMMRHAASRLMTSAGTICWICSSQETFVAESGWFWRWRSFEFARWWSSSLRGAPAVCVLTRQTYPGVTEVVDCAVRIVIGRPRTQRYAQGTQDKIFIQVWAAKVVNPTYCLGDQVWRTAFGVGLGVRLGTRPSFIYSRGRVPSRLQGRSPSRVTRNKS